jgi:phosphomannomutase
MDDPTYAVGLSAPPRRWETITVIRIHFSDKIDPMVMRSNTRMIAVNAEDLAGTIKFGTSGWRELMQPGAYSEGNLGRVAKAVADELLSRIKAGSYSPLDKKKAKVLVAFDAREYADVFAHLVVEVLSAYDEIEVALGDAIATTPSVVSQTRQSLGSKAFDLALHVTASHNDTRYCGLKVLQEGVVAPDEFTAAIAARANDESNNKAYPRLTLKDNEIKKAAVVKDMEDRYAAVFQSSMPQMIDLIKSFTAKDPAFSFTVDCMYGSTAPFTGILEKIGGRVIRKEPMKTRPFKQGNVFNEKGELKSYRPEPNKVFLDEEAFTRFEKTASDGSLYIALDGDGDRMALWIKHNGAVVEFIPNKLGVLYAWFAEEYDYAPGSKFIVRTLPTTAAMDAIARWARKKLFVTPVGSKYFASFMKDKSKNKASVCTEESGHQGLNMRGEMIFDDATSQAVHVVEMMALSGKGLIELLDHAEKDIAFKGVYQRINKDLQGELKSDIERFVGEDMMKKHNVQKFSDAMEARYGERVGQVSATAGNGKVMPLGSLIDQKLEIKVNEGIHIQFNDFSWAQVRLSGTEPVARVYSEVCQAVGESDAAAEKRRQKLEDAFSAAIGIMQ